MCLLCSLHVACDSFSFDFLQFDSLIGKTVEIVVSSVADLAGNMVSWPVIWSFPVADYGANAASVRVSGLVLATTYAAFQAKTGELAKIQQDLATLLSVPLARITSTTAYSGLDGNVTAVSFVIAAPGAGDTKTAVTAAQDLAQKLAQATPGLAGSLATAVTSKVVHTR